MRIFGFESDEIVCVLGDLNARVGDGKVQHCKKFR